MYFCFLLSGNDMDKPFALFPKGFFSRVNPGPITINANGNGTVKFHADSNLDSLFLEQIFGASGSISLATKFLI